MRWPPRSLSVGFLSFGGGGGFAPPMEDDLAMDESLDSLAMSKCAAAPRPNVEAAMVSVSERTKPVCRCGKELEKYQVRFAYGGDVKVSCDRCGKEMDGDESIVFHCPDGKTPWQHRNGYDLCVECGDEQLAFDELRGLMDEDSDYALERNQEYPVRVTLQYYKATDNGAVDKEIMDDVVKQLEASQKQSDFMGSLVTEYDPQRPTEWTANPKQDEAKGDGDGDGDGDGGDGDYGAIRAALEEHGGKDWKTFFQNFQDEEVTDADLEGISADDLKELIPRMGPRNRFKKWMEERK